MGTANASIVSIADRLIAQYKDEADIVAAQRADRSFADGKVYEGEQWLAVFRSIAGRELLQTSH